MNKQETILTVCIRTFNQKEFIETTLDSVLMQITSFSFNIIISDDSSNDGTKEIIQQYQRRFPEKISLIIGINNIGGPANLRRVIEASSSKYITCLDGDDYYLDEYKLQKQVDFLEGHPEFTACFHNALNVNVDGAPISLFNPLDFPSIIDAHYFIQNDWFIPIHSAMIRRELIIFPDWYESVINDDYVVHLSVVKNGPYYYRPDVMVAYRHHSHNTSSIYKDEVLTAMKLRDILNRYSKIFPKEYLHLFRERINEYDNRIAFLESERKHPWKKIFRITTYKRYIKKALGNISK